MTRNEDIIKLSDTEIIDYFCDMFYHELESWFSADIACCDECYDDFISKWPAVNFINDDFQKKSIDIKSFYSGTMLSKIFTLEEYIRLISNISCPSCSKPIRNNFWTFNFNIPDYFETELEELDKIAQKTPFLLLSNPLAKKAFDTINDLSQKTIPIIIDKQLYRARKLQKDKLYIDEDFKCPPKDKIKEGRYNHAGFPVIYLADSPNTCFYELRKPNEGIAIAEINITKPMKILDLLQVQSDYDNVLNTAVWSSLMSSPEEGEGWYKPQYMFTRYIADCAASAGFDAIKYPSVRLGKRYNMVILDGNNGWGYLQVNKITKMSVVDKVKLY